jgi:hypothetical protein
MRPGEPHPRPLPVKNGEGSRPATASFPTGRGPESEAAYDGAGAEFVA